MLRSVGEWFSAYQRVTHYLRALDVWRPPPHLLAVAILERAMSRADEKRDAPLLRLAMSEVHILLGQRMSAWRDAAAAGDDSFGSVCWRLASWLGEGEPPQGEVHEAWASARFRPVPAEAPGPMPAQPYEISPLARVARTFATGIRHFRPGAAWRRRHA